MEVMVLSGDMVQECNLWEGRLVIVIFFYSKKEW